MRFNIRSSGLIDDFQNKIFHILGCGAIGSSAAITLARMGANNFVLYDMDKVNIENIGISQYNISDIGKKKTKALKDAILHINTEVDIQQCDHKFSKFPKQLDNSDIVILGFDSMEARKEAATEATNRSNRPFLLIDGRMGAEEYQQYVLVNPRLKDYLKYWYSDDEADDDPCNAKGTSYCSNMAGSFITNAVKKVLNEEGYSEEFFFKFHNYVFGKSAITN